MENASSPFNLSLPPLVRQVLARLIDAGYEAYIVGGALRDTFLLRPVPDWDIATSAPCDRIRALFSDTKHYHLKHETVTLVLPDRRVEITPYRDPGRSLGGDLARRDFTVNAMAFDPFRQRLIDPWGGLKDLELRMIRATGDPDARFMEDPLRLLRGIRLAAQSGFAIHRHTLAAIKTNAFLVNHAAMERVREELVKLLADIRPSRGFRLMARCGMLDQIIPELSEGIGVTQNSRHRHTVFDHTMETVDAVVPRLHLRLAALFHDIAKPRVRERVRGTWRFLDHARKSSDLAKEILARLRFSRTLMEKVAHLINNHMIEYSEEWGDGAVRRFIRRVGPEHMGDLLLLRRADLRAHRVDSSMIRSLEELERRIVSITRETNAVSLGDLALNGHDVMAILDLEPGPSVGRALQHLLEAVTDDPALNNPEDLSFLLSESPPTDREAC
jgi:tRNA nucleotidyltransferase (CCA-adding enzyme)